MRPGITSGLASVKGEDLAHEVANLFESAFIKDDDRWTRAAQRASEQARARAVCNASSSPGTKSAR